MAMSGTRSSRLPAVAVIPRGYTRFLTEVKERIRRAQVRTVFAANRELIRLYWDIGRRVVERQEREGWGEAVIERLAADVQKGFPGIGGFSRSNLFYMRQFYLAYRERGRKVQQLVGQIPWGHNVTILSRVHDPQQREWYARQALANGWSRSILALQIETALHRRQGRAVTNFRTALPPPGSDLVRQALKDPYVFDFLTLSEDTRERELERGLLEHIERFLVELGKGFAFVGRQVHLAIGGDEYYLDLLFYHLGLRRYVVVELKAVPFRPEFAGKMNFYLSAVDDRLRGPGDQPSIGLLLCKEKDRVVVEYALRDLRKPIGVANWTVRLVETLPKKLKGQLPTVAEIEAELVRVPRTTMK